MNRQALTRRLAATAAAALATVATTGSVFALLHSTTSTPWLPAERVALFAHCNAHTAQQRQACVRSAAAGTAAVRVAAR